MDDGELRRRLERRFDELRELAPRRNYAHFLGATASGRGRRERAAAALTGAMIAAVIVSLLVLVVRPEWPGAGVGSDGSVTPSSAVTPGSPAAVAPDSPPPATATASLVGPRIVCGRLNSNQCEAVVAFARDRIDGAKKAGTIVADHQCEPGEFCAYGFRVYVAVFGTEDFELQEWPTVYFIRGAGGPERVEGVDKQLSSTFKDLLVAAGWPDRR